MAARLTQLDVLNLLKILDDEPVEERHAEKLVKRGLCRVEGREVFVTAKGEEALKKAGADHAKMKAFGKTLGPKTKLDLILDTVQPGKHEVTFDTEGYTPDQVAKIVAAAQVRGLSASFDGRFVLVRDLR